MAEGTPKSTRSYQLARCITCFLLLKKWRVQIAPKSSIYCQNVRPLILALLVNILHRDYIIVILHSSRPNYKSHSLQVFHSATLNWFSWQHRYVESNTWAKQLWSRTLRSVLWLATQQILDQRIWWLCWALLFCLKWHWFRGCNFWGRG